MTFRFYVSFLLENEKLLSNCPLQLKSCCRGPQSLHCFCFDYHFCQFQFKRFWVLNLLIDASFNTRIEGLSKILPYMNLFSLDSSIVIQIPT